MKRVKSELKSIRQQNTGLREQLAKHQNPKNSRNSSIPPSKDNNRPKPNQSLRQPSGKKPGGQFGRKGTTLEMTKTPDTTIDLYPEYCHSCGADWLSPLLIGL